MDYLRMFWLNNNIRPRLIIILYCKQLFIDFWWINNAVIPYSSVHLFYIIFLMIFTGGMQRGDKLPNHTQDVAKGKSNEDTFSEIVKEPWFIATVGVFAWLVMLVIVVFLCCRRKRKKHHHFRGSTSTYESRGKYKRYLKFENLWYLYQIIFTVPWNNIKPNRATLCFNFLHLLWPVCTAILFRSIGGLVASLTNVVLFSLRFIFAFRFVLYFYTHT